LLGYSGTHLGTSAEDARPPYNDTTIKSEGKCICPSVRRSMKLLAHCTRYCSLTLLH
jgi:hypothetical protein